MTHIAEWIHNGTVSRYIYFENNKFIVKEIGKEDIEPFLMEIIYDTISKTFYLSCEWAKKNGEKSKPKNSPIHIFPICSGIISNDILTIVKNKNIPSAYDWNSPTIERKIKFIETPHTLNTLFLKKVREILN